MLVIILLKPYRLVYGKVEEKFKVSITLNINYYFIYSYFSRYIL